MGTNTETFEVGSDIEQTSNKLERKRKREDSSLNSCSATWRKKPNLHQKKKRKVPVQSEKKKHAWHVIISYCRMIR